MDTLYVTEPGACVRREGQRFSVWKGKQRLASVAAFDVAQVVLFGNVSVTPAALFEALRKGVDLVLLSRTGTYRGRLVGPDRQNVILRQMQFRRYEDDAFRLDAARAFVRGKVRNMRTLLMRWGRRRRVDMASAAHRLRFLGERASRVDSPESLRGIEGAATALYFQGYREFMPAAFRFKTRNRRPPKDPANAMLSFGYALLAGDIESAVYRVGLDPYMGYLHLVDYGRPSLALDLMEEFRPVIVDALVLDLLAHGRMHPGDFESRDGGVFLAGEGRKRYIAAYQERVLTEIQYPTGKDGVQKVTYRRCFELQVRALARVIRGDDAAYLPFLVR